MRDDILRQAVLAIAVSIDIKEEDYTRRVPAGTDLRQLEDPAFYVLSNELLARFRVAWERGIPPQNTPDGKGLPPLQNVFTSSRIISGLVHYIALELNWAVYHLPVETTSKMLEASYHTIVNRFIHSEEGDMLTELASRKCVYEAVRNHLIKSNTHQDANTRNMLFHSNRPQIVFDMFKEYFREHSATAFRFEGKYIDFVMNAYQNYFYANHKKDIWDAFYAEDTAKREIEIDAHAVRYLEQGGVPADMNIHEPLINIGEANVELFTHSGHRDEVNGVMYDSYYLELCHLCELYAANLNQKLEGFSIEFKDPYSRTEGKDGNKGIGAKVSNAKMLLPMMFDYIRSGNFNVSLLLDFRRQCFQLGRGDTQSTNPVWVSTGEDNSGESARYLDTDKGLRNYMTFEIVFKAVASIYNIMRALVDRGRDLVEEYIKGRPEPNANGVRAPFSDWFINSNIYRYMDYLSSLDYLPLMRKLQAESGQADVVNGVVKVKTRPGNGDGDLGSGELLDFVSMVNLYAGSSKNTNSNINANRSYDFTHGLLSRPKLKERDPLTTPFEQKRSVFHYMTAIPYSYMEVDARRLEEYEASMRQAQVRNIYLLFEFPSVVVDYRSPDDLNTKHQVYNSSSGYTDYAQELYKGLRYNSILARKQEYACQHLSTAAARGEMDTLAWHIGTSDFPCLMAFSAAPNGRQVTAHGVEQHWLTRLYMDVPMFEANLVAYIGQLEEDPTPRVYWTNVPFAGENAWIAEGRGYRCYGCAPFANDLHALSVAGDVKAHAPSSYVTATDVRENAWRARQRLEGSLGFALYIGVDNLGKPEIKDTILDKIPVYLDYRGQVELYRERLVELSWMQEDFVQLLQLMYSYCWVMTLPEAARSQSDYDHAHSLYNSLLTHVFKKKDLDWFFARLEACYYDDNGVFKQKHMWPRHIVNYDGNKTADSRRAPIEPRWALTLGGRLEQLAKDAGMEPFTQFEGGPYEQFMAAARDYTDTSERFVLLHTFLYEKTLFIKLLRDAYTLTFGALPEDNNTVSCELNSMLGVTDVFDPSDLQWTSEIAVLTSMDSDDSSGFVRRLVVQDCSDFKVLLHALNEHYEFCTENIRTLVNYDVAADERLSSKFDKWHDALNMIPPVTNSDILNQIRGQYVCDSHNYFLAGTDYFKVDYGGDTLYLHYSGHFLKATRNGQFEAFTLPTRTDQELYEYEQVLKKVMGSVRYSDYE